MDIEKFTKSLGSLKVGDSYKMSEYISGHSNEAVRSAGIRHINESFNQAHCIEVEGSRNGRRYIRLSIQDNPDICIGCPLSDNCTIR
jgi:hypothetical protein